LSWRGVTGFQFQVDRNLSLKRETKNLQPETLKRETLTGGESHACRLKGVHSGLV
jgi:hypothetical protein